LPRRQKRSGLLLQETAAASASFALRNQQPF
jgi:hypothetical protein